MQNKRRSWVAIGLLIPLLLGPLESLAQDWTTQRMIVLPQTFTVTGGGGGTTGGPLGGPGGGGSSTTTTGGGASIGGAPSIGARSGGSTGAGGGASGSAGPEAPGDTAEPITAYCLDRSLDAPDYGLRFGASPATLGRGSVTVGNSTKTLSQAIADKDIAVWGAGADAVLFENLRGGTATITIEEPTIILPDSSYNTPDLPLARERVATLAASGESFFLQLEIWGERAADTYQSLGFTKIAEAMRDTSPNSDESVDDGLERESATLERLEELYEGSLANIARRQMLVDGAEAGAVLVDRKLVGGGERFVVYQRGASPVIAESPSDLRALSTLGRSASFVVHVRGDGDVGELETVAMNIRLGAVVNGNDGGRIGSIASGPPGNEPPRSPPSAAAFDSDGRPRRTGAVRHEDSAVLVSTATEPYLLGALEKARSVFDRPTYATSTSDQLRSSIESEIMGEWERLAMTKIPANLEESRGAPPPTYYALLKNRFYRAQFRGIFTVLVPMDDADETLILVANATLQ